MTLQGASLDEIGSGFASAMVEWELYPSSTPELALALSLESRVRYLWNHPRERNVEIVSARLSSIKVGFGLVGEANTPEWPYAGHYAQLSLYSPKRGRLMEEEGTRISKTRDAAWIMFEGRFASGMTTRMKINFYFDVEVGDWVPLTVVFGTDGDHRPFPML